jgi:4-alpha-glucanotransferase
VNPTSTTRTISPELLRLAALHGVGTSYEDFAGRPVEVGESAVVSALAALGVDASAPAAVEQALLEAGAAPWRRLIPPSVLVRGRSGEVVTHAPEGVDVVLQVELEDGTRQDLPVGEVTGRRDGRERRAADLVGLPLGWHRLRATAGSESAESVLVVAPGRIELPDGLHRAWGWMVQLYSLRSAGSWAMGDYGDLRTVVDRAAADGAGVVLVNPLHAETPVLPLAASPYSPSSRRFRSAVSLRIPAVPEYAAAPEDVRSAVDALRPDAEPDRIPRDPVWRAKLAALELLWPAHREQVLQSWREAQGRPLEEFALFCALAEEHGVPWQSWPEDLRRPDGPGIASARERLAGRVAFWCWVQLLVDEQLAGIGEDMVVGVVHDLAVGVDAGGADAWALQDALALGTTIGAPPDSFNQQGQDWGLPPWRPDRLAELGYLPFRDVVRAVLRHAGGLRIDHVMGLFRLWWVPAGASAAEGTYVSYDSDALLAVLALEAVRAGAIVVGEDLGTVEDRVRESLTATGVLGSSVLWFETEEGEFLPPEQWRELSLATVTTHDLPTAAGFLAEEHVRVRHELDQLGLSLEQEQARVRDERSALLRRLEQTGLLARHDGDVVLAMHAMLTRSPSRLVLAALGDAVGDVRQPNLPGTVDEYPNWRLPVADGSGRPLDLEELLERPEVRRLSALLAAGVATKERSRPSAHEPAAQPPGNVR